MAQAQKVFLSGKKDILEVVALFGGGLLVVEIILAILLYVGQIDDVVFPLGALLMVSIGGLMVLLTAAVQMPLNMNRAVKFGIPRKDALLGTIEISFGMFLCWLLFFGLGLGLDILVHILMGSNMDFSKLWSILEVTGLNKPMSALKIIGIICLVFMILSVIMGLLILKFGKAGFWSLYIISFGTVFLSSRIDGIINENTIGGKLVHFLSTNIPTAVWWSLAVVAVVAALVWLVKTALQLEVNDAFS